MNEVDWGGYLPFEPAVHTEVRDLSRADARKEFDHWIATTEQRKEELARLVRANGLALEGTDEGVQRLNDWFVASVQGDPESPGRLRPIWYSVVHDVAVFLGDEMIKQSPALRWVLFVHGRSNISYQRPVIMGFTKHDASLHINVDVERVVSTYGHRVVESKGSVASIGIVNVRGTPIDVDEVAARHRSQTIPTDLFVKLLEQARTEA